MQFKRLRKSFRKKFKAQQKQVEFLGAATEKSIERNVFKRFGRLVAVRRFVLGWISLMVLLIAASVLQFQHLGAYYQSVKPVDGGVYNEGMVGSISNISPLYATGDVDRSISRLVFSGLLGYDASGALVPTLAKSYSVSENGRLYTVKLKPNLRWHDGHALTSSDVLFTYNTIKNPDAQSPLLSTWQRITISAPDAQTVTFQLPSALASFPYSLVTGIVPKHVLGKVTASTLRSNEFNTTKPVGAGPFKWQGLQLTGDTLENTEEQVALVPFENYSLGKPKLAEFIIRAFGSQARLEQAFTKGQLTAVAGLDAEPKNLPKASESHSLILKAGTYVFFKTSNPVLTSATTRRALVAASNPNEVIASLPYMTRPVTEPILNGQLGYDKKYAQQSNNLAAAQALLAQDGWQLLNGVQTKNSQKLTFNLVIADTPEYRRAAQQLSEQWAAIGAKVLVQRLPITEYSTALANHDYDATLHGISIGEDPDVYAYWHSSQADVRSSNRLNISEWKNTTADQALEAGRTRLDGQLRTIKYVPFLQAWQQEAPALGLYQPRALYITRGPLYGLTEQTITSNIDRYNGVENWRIRSAMVSN